MSALSDIFRNEAVIAVLAGALTGAGGWLTGRRQRDALASKTQAETSKTAAEAAGCLADMVIKLEGRLDEQGKQIVELMESLASAKYRAEIAEARAAALERRATEAEEQVAKLRVEVDQLRSKLMGQNTVEVSAPTPEG